MRKQLLIILIVILSTNCFSQVSFEKGYYINNNEQKIECLIKNVDWKNNPTEFKYKLSEDSEEKKTTIKLVKEFGVYNYSKHIRSTVNIDRSSKNLNDLSPTRSPIFKEEELFLKVLVDGKSNLYQYEDRNLVRFFYDKVSSNTIEQLIFKYYTSTIHTIGENETFKQQLLNDLKCQDIEARDVEKIRYDKGELVKLFVRYNQCSNSELINFDKKQKKDLFNLTPRLGLNSSSLSVQNALSSTRNVDFGNKLGIRLGIEAEIILPFNKNKWAVIIEPTYRSFKSEKTLTTLDTKIDYTSIELPVGIRHYFFINSNSKLFVNGSCIMDFASNSILSYSTGAEFEINKSINFGFGVGYKQNDKYSLELRCHTNRKLLHGLSDADFSTVSVILGYSIF